MPDRDDTIVPIAIDPEKVAFIIVKAREFDVKVEPDDPDSGSNPADDREADVLEDLTDDATLEELTGAINGLNDDEVIDLIALAWVGRGDFDKTQWPEARALANERHRPSSAQYLTGMPMLGDYLEEGLAQLGYTPADLASDHL